MASRDDHLATLGDGVEHDHRRGGVVVDDRGRLGAGEPLEEPLDRRVALAASARVGIGLQQRVPAELLLEPSQDGLGQHGAAETRVKDNARGVDHVLIIGSLGGVGPLAHAGQEKNPQAGFVGFADDRVGRVGEQFAAKLLDGRTHAIDQDATRHPLGQGGQRRILQKRFDGGQFR